MHRAPRDRWEGEEDDLFRPTVADGVRDPSLPAPWRVRSQLWVAFFGGSFALLIVAGLNLRRLGVDLRSVAPRMLGATLLVVGAVTAVAAGLVAADAFDGQARYVRWAYRGGALLLHLYFARLQEPAHRRWLMTAADAHHASLWGPGLVACVAGGALQAALLTLILLPAYLLSGGAP